MNLNAEKMMANCFYVIDKDSGGKPCLFVLRREQKILYDKIAKAFNKGEGYRGIILKGRQFGVSTFAMYLMLALALIKVNQTYMLVTHREDTSQELYNRMKYALEHLPKAMRERIVIGKNNSGELEIVSFSGEERNNHIYIKTASANNDGLGRGYSINYLHMSEYPQWQGNKENSFKALMDACAKDAIVLIESTARGFDDFRKKYKDAEAGKNNFEPIFFAWYKFYKNTMPYSGFELNDEERYLHEHLGATLDNLEWRRWKIREYGGDINWFHQENPSTPDEAFLSSGDCIFDLNKLNKQIEAISNKPVVINKGRFEYEVGFNDYTKKRFIKSYKWIEDKYGFIDIYEKPKKGYPYVIGLDPSGEGSDYHAYVGINNINDEIVCQLHKEKMEVFDRSAQAYCLGTYYNNALLVPETNYDTGLTSTLNELEYSNIYVQENDGTQIENNYGKKYGFRTTTKTRPPLISSLREYFNELIESVKSVELLNEAQNFVRSEKEVGGRIVFKEQANEGYHDDLIMALGLAIAGRNSLQQTFEIQKEEEPPKQLDPQYLALFGDGDKNSEGENYDTYFPY